ncbi:MAG: DinB family protein [Candidatus Acidiferrum sp.]
MTETAQQYTQRILKNLEGKNPLKTQAATAKTLGKLLKGVPGSRLRKRPAPEKWSVVEILAHLADAEIVVAWRLRAILAAPGTPIQAYDQDALAAARKYAKHDPHKSLEHFRVVREANLAFYKSLSPEQWKRHGVHAERGEESLEHILHMMAGHDINHTKQIEQILKRKKK